MNYNAVDRYKENNEYKSIKLLIENKKYKSAEKYLKIFIENYPNNRYAVVEYAKLLRKQGDNKQAKFFLEKSMKMEANKYAAMELLFLYVEEREYENAYKFLRICKELLSCNEKIYSKIINIETFLKYKFNILNKPNSDYYFQNQLYNYDKSVAIDHVKQHKHEDDKKYKHSLFNEKIGIKELFKMVSRQLDYSKRIKGTNVTDVYLFHHDNIGNYDGKKTDYFEVVTIKDTQNIITMYPINIEEFYHTDVIELNETQYTSNKQITKMSQIDKFNNKYKK